MPIITFAPDGTPTAQAILTRDSSGTLYLDGQTVLATSQWGRLVALTLVNRLVLIHVADFARLIPRCRLRAAHSPQQHDQYALSA